MKHIRSKNNGTKRHMQLLAVLMVPVVVLIIGAAVPEVLAQPECFFNIELNATDEDVGVRGFFDYEPWDALTIDDPNDDEIASVVAGFGLAAQGFAEWFFESGEPQLWQPENGGPIYTFNTFFTRFPENGVVRDFYLFTATPNDGTADVECEAEFTHVIPCGPEVDVKVHGSSKVTISWDEVDEVVDTDESDDIQEIVCGEPDDELEIEEYLVIVEGEDNDTELQFNVPSDVTEVVIPQDLFGEGSEYKVEVLAVEESGNQSITEEEFELK